MTHFLSKIHSSSSVLTQCSKCTKLLYFLPRARPKSAVSLFSLGWHPAQIYPKMIHFLSKIHSSLSVLTQCSKCTKLLYFLPRARPTSAVSLFSLGWHPAQIHPKITHFLSKIHSSFSVLTQCSKCTKLLYFLPRARPKSAVTLFSLDWHPAQIPLL